MAIKYEYYDVGYDNTITARDVRWVGQSFTPAIEHIITSVKIKCFRNGNPGTVTVSIKATVDGKPNGGDLCFNSFDGNTLPDEIGGAIWKEITFGAGALLSSGIQYAIVVKAPDGSVDNQVRWWADSSSPDYPGGAMVYSSDSGEVWTVYDAHDMYFEDWGELAVGGGQDGPVPLLVAQGII